jgi:hypothetical protein
LAFVTAAGYGSNPATDFEQLTQLVAGCGKAEKSLAYARGSEQCQRAFNNLQNGDREGAIPRLARTSPRHNIEAPACAAYVPFLPATR